MQGYTQSLVLKVHSLELSDYQFAIPVQQDLLAHRQVFPPQTTLVTLATIVQQEVHRNDQSLLFALLVLIVPQDQELLLLVLLENLIHSLIRNNLLTVLIAPLDSIVPPLA